MDNTELFPICPGQTIEFPFDTVLKLEVRSASTFSVLLNGEHTASSKDLNLAGHQYSEAVTGPIRSVLYTGELNGWIVVNDGLSPVIGNKNTSETIKRNKTVIKNQLRSIRLMAVMLVIISIYTLVNALSLLANSAAF